MAKPLEIKVIESVEELQKYLHNFITNTANLLSYKLIITTCRYEYINNAICNCF
jgi:hypothetical protein